MKNKINIEIDLEESYEDIILDHIDHVISSQLKDLIKKSVDNQINPMLAGAVKLAILDKLDSFLNEEIAVTDRYGKATFIGSIDDLLKKEFDDKLLHPVDSNGNRLIGCTTQSTTYIQWLLSKEMNKTIGDSIANASRNLNTRISTEVKHQVDSYTQEIINQKVSSSFMNLLKNSIQGK